MFRSNFIDRIAISSRARKNRINHFASIISRWLCDIFLLLLFYLRPSRFADDPSSKKSAIQKPDFRYIRIGGLINDSDCPALVGDRYLRCFVRAEIKRRIFLIRALRTFFCQRYLDARETRRSSHWDSPDGFHFMHNWKERTIEWGRNW